MSSTNKTEHLGLNAWRGSDVPQMEDFNRDNALLDAAVGTHQTNGPIHITAAERTKWNNVYHIFTYYGNGNATRNIALESSFTPRWGMVFASGRVPSVTDFDGLSDYNYFAVFSTSGSMTGASLSGKTLTVQQSPVAVQGNEYRNFNEPGVTYVGIVFA